MSSIPRPILAWAITAGITLVAILLIWALAHVALELLTRKPLI